MAISNTFTETNGDVYPEEIAVGLQERLDKPQNWKEIADVVFSMKKDINIPYMSTEFSGAALTRGSAYSLETFTLTGEQLTINTGFKAAPFVDRADLAQITYLDQMELAERISRVINEKIESVMLADHSNWTNVGLSGGDIATGQTAQITVSASNVDDIIRAVRSFVMVANGKELMDRYGLFVVWRGADWPFVEQFLQANGYNLADQNLKNGTEPGYYALGVYHYVSNSHTDNHIMAGVRKIQKIGLLSSTYGQLVINQDPPDSGNGPVSGMSFVSRVDYGVQTPTGLKTLLYDVNVA